MNENRTITMTAKVGAASTPPAWRDSEHDAWTVTLRFQGRQATFPYFSGMGHRVDGHPSPPSIGYVLSSLASEASTDESCASADDFADEYGYDLDDPDERRNARNTFAAIQRQTRQVRTLLGDYFEVLVYRAPDGGDWSEFKGDTLVFPDFEIPEDFPVRELDDDENPEGKATCGSCGRSWDDSISTGWTPAPSARCPFEAFHAEGNTA
jgi:hypothetical protein